MHLSKPQLYFFFTTQQSHIAYNFAPQCSQKFPPITSILHLGHFTFPVSCFICITSFFVTY
nr:MAG TPA: hypothetical protein [Caudoviricetes sp.]DAO71232.1 MAG TPA: hypothetical protein [Caudoviricetes sp.]